MLGSGGEVVPVSEEGRRERGVLAGRAPDQSTHIIKKGTNLFAFKRRKRVYVKYVRPSTESCDCASFKGRRAPALALTRSRHQLPLLTTRARLRRSEFRELKPGRNEKGLSPERYIYGQLRACCIGSR
jgi:hypothetical protein